VTPDELSVVRQRLEAFAADVFAPLARSDQRVKGQTYLRGLLLDGRRKSIQPMAARLGVDHQGLQQFVTTSTWDTMAVRARLAERAVQLIDPVAWVFDDTGFPKDGTASPGVARQYSGTLGKVANCQIGVSVHAVTDTASCPLDWRLFLPESWDVVKAGPAAVKAAKAKQRKTLTNAPRAAASAEPAQVDVDAVAASATETARQRRGKSVIPDDEGHRPKWMLAIEMLDGLAEHGLRPPMVAADSGYGDSGPFRAAHWVRGTVFQCTPCCGWMSSSGQLSTGSIGRPSRGATISFASTIQVLAQTSSPGRASSRWPSSGSRRSSSGLPEPSTASCLLPFGWRVSVDRVRNGMSTPSMSTKINGRVTPATLRNRSAAWRSAGTPLDSSDRDPRRCAERAATGLRSCAGSGLFAAP
jgi:hypothetical protein